MLSYPLHPINNHTKVNIPSVVLWNKNLPLINLWTDVVLYTNNDCIASCLVPAQVAYIHQLGWCNNRATARELGVGIARYSWHMRNEESGCKLLWLRLSLEEQQSTLARMVYTKSPCVHVVMHKILQLFCMRLNIYTYVSAPWVTVWETWTQLYRKYS